MAITPFVARSNKYYIRSRISEKRFRHLVRLFSLELSASDTARLTGLTTKTVNSIYLKIRRRIAEACERESPFTNGEVEVDESDFGARRVRGRDEFVVGAHHINGIESFWSFARRRLQKFNGVPFHTFYLHLKECEWRFNNRNADLYHELLKLLRNNPI